MFGQVVSGNYFTMLGIGAAEGRPLLPRDASVPGSGAVMVVSYDAWKNKFGGDPNLVGKTVHLRGHAFEVVGIANPGFAGLASFPCGFWIPLTMDAAVQDGRDLQAFPQPERLELIGRLQEGMQPETAKAALTAWTSGFGAKLPAEQRPVGVAMRSSATTVPLIARRDRDFRPDLYGVRAGAADCLRERVQHDAGAGAGAAAGDRHTGIAGGGTFAAGAATIDGERAAGGSGGGAGIRDLAGDDRRSKAGDAGDRPGGVRPLLLAAGADARLAGVWIHPAGLGGCDLDVRHGAGDTDHAVAAGGGQSRGLQQRLPAGAIAERAAGYAGGGVFAAADCDGDCAAQPAAGDGANDRAWT